MSRQLPPEIAESSETQTDKAYRFSVKVVVWLFVGFLAFMVLRSVVLALIDLGSGAADAVGGGLEVGTMEIDTTLPSLPSLVLILVALSLALVAWVGRGWKLAAGILLAAGIVWLLSGHLPDLTGEFSRSGLTFPPTSFLMIAGLIALAVALKSWRLGLGVFLILLVIGILAPENHGGSWFGSARPTGTTAQCSGVAQSLELSESVQEINPGAICFVYFKVDTGRIKVCGPQGCMSTGPEGYGYNDFPISTAEAVGSKASMRYIKCARAKHEEGTWSCL